MCFFTISLTSLLLAAAPDVVAVEPVVVIERCTLFDPQR